MGAEEHFAEVCRSLVGLVGKQEAVMRTDEVCSTTAWLTVRALSHSLHVQTPLAELSNLSLSRFLDTPVIWPLRRQWVAFRTYYANLTLLAFGFLYSLKK